MAEPKDRMMEIAPTSYLRVDGASIVDGSGTPVRLQGHCLGGWMNMENFITGYPATETLHRRALLKAMGPVAYEAFFDQFLTDFFSDSDAAYLADLGTNAMRIPISYRHFESDERPKVLIEAGLKWLDRAVNTLAAHRIYSIIDLHAAPGFQNHHWHSDNPTHWPLFWEYADFKERAIWLWEVLADHFKGNGWIAGFNLLNEPADQDGNRLIAWYSETARRVRDIDPDRMLFLDGNRYSTDFSMFTEPLANTVYTAHDYVMAGLDPHGHYSGELDGRYPGSAKGEVYNKDTIHEQFLRRTSFMRNLGLPIWIGEFGPLYNGTPQQAEERYQLMHDQLDIYRDYSASWALWLYKDIGLQGVVFAAADSPYVSLLIDFLAKKKRLGADSWGGTDEQIREVVEPLEALLAREFPDFNPYPWGAQKWASRLLRHILISEALIPEFAERFRGITPHEARELARSFRWEACTRRIGLEQTLRLELAKR
jgi:endoglucanase